MGLEKGVKTNMVLVLSFGGIMLVINWNWYQKGSILQVISGESGAGPACSKGIQLNTHYF